MTPLRLYSSMVIFFLAGLVIGFAIFYQPKTTAVTKQPVYTERYYCHETGFLMHHWRMSKDSAWMDTMERNRWEEPIKCEKPE